jgi:hypothetical protein
MGSSHISQPFHLIFGLKTYTVRYWPGIKYNRVSLKFQKNKKNQKKILSEIYKNMFLFVCICPNSKTSTIGNGNPHPTYIDSRTRSIRMMPRRQLFFDKLFFSHLENQGREIIPPTNNKCGKEVYWSENWVTLNMYGYAFIYTDSRLKQTLMNPLCGLIWGAVIIKARSNLDFDVKCAPIQFYGNNHNSQSDRWIRLKFYVDSPDMFSYLELKV